MNVLFIVSDEHSGSAIHSSGDKDAVTPNLDKLAEKGTTFTSAYSSCPVCVPARASLFTGDYVCRLGTWDNSTPYDGKILGMAEHFKNNGIPYYQIGKTHFHIDGEYHFASGDNLGLLSKPDLGCYYRDNKAERIGAENRFKEVGISDGAERFDDKVLKSTLSFLTEHKDDKSPWILGVGLIEPHFPFNIKKENWDYFESYFKEVPLPKEVLPPYTSLNSSYESLRRYFKADLATEDVIKRIRIGYYAAIKELDEKIGLILDKLEELNLDKDTIVIYTSDHGEQLGFHGLWWKCTMFDQSARIPLIVSLPKALKEKENSEPISLVDIFPTLCDALNVDKIENIDGETFWPLVNGEKMKTRRDFAFSEFNAHGLPGGIYMIRWKNYKYVFFTEDPPQLFDMGKDPLENNNLLLNPNDEILEVQKECEKRLFSVCDPFEVTKRSKEFQKKMKKALELPDEYVIARGGAFVPHPDYSGFKK